MKDKTHTEQMDEIDEMRDEINYHKADAKKWEAAAEEAKVEAAFYKGEVEALKNALEVLVSGVGVAGDYLRGTLHHLEACAASGHHSATKRPKFQKKMHARLVFEPVTKDEYNAIE